MPDFASYQNPGPPKATPKKAAKKKPMLSKSEQRKLLAPPKGSRK